MNHLELASETPQQPVDVDTNEVLREYGLDGINVTSTVVQQANGTSVTIPDSVTRLGGYAFSDCDNLHDVKLSSNMTEIRGYTFQYCGSLRSVAMPKSLTRIGGYAFYGCRSLESITIPEGTQTIGGHAFHDCSSLGNVVFPSSLKDIGSSAFRACSNLRTANVPCGISINTRAFKESPTSLQCFGGDGYTIHYYTTD